MVNTINQVYNENMVELKKVEFKILPETHKKLKAYSALEGKSMTKVVEELLWEWFEKVESKNNQ